MGSLLGEANCLLNLGEVAEPAEGQRLAKEALALYSRIPDPYSMARAHITLARLSDERAERRGHVAAARDLWTGIDRPDLVEELRAEFGDDMVPDEQDRLTSA